MTLVDKDVKGVWVLLGKVKGVWISDFNEIVGLRDLFFILSARYC